MTHKPRLNWPDGSGLSRDPKLPTLLLFVDPRCSTVNESILGLRQLLERVDGRVRVLTLVSDSSQQAATQSSGFAIQSLRSIPGVSIHHDGDGRCALLYGATVSGEAMLYFPDGTLHYRGSVDNSGDVENAGTSNPVLETCIVNASAPGRVMPVTGCLLRTSDWTRERFQTAM